MGRIVKVYVVDLRGKPLLCDIEEDEEEAYRRNLAGFRMERGNESLGRGGNERPPVESDEEDAEGIVLEVEEEDEEEDDS